MIAAFCLAHPLSYVLLVFVIPVFYGAHEALHDTLVPRTGFMARTRSVHNELAALVGFAIQGMNVNLLRPAHLHHHAFGRYDEGYSPDVVPDRPTLADRVRYYVSLCGLPAIAWQFAGYAVLIAPPSRLPFLVNIRFPQPLLTRRYCIHQLAVILFTVFAIAMGGWLKWLVFQGIFCLAWSLLQNVSHYRLRGNDPITDRVCARTYILERPFRLLTFGSTSHLAHHVDPDTPGLLLHTSQVLAQTERRLGVGVRITRGVFRFGLDVLRQFQGPVPARELETSWAVNLPIGDGEMNEGLPPLFGRRTGRKWRVRTYGN